MNDSGKCAHRHLNVHKAENGYDFIAQCADCGLWGEKPGRTPVEARKRFNRARGRRPHQKLAGAALARHEERLAREAGA